MTPDQERRLAEALKAIAREARAIGHCLNRMRRQIDLTVRCLERGPIPPEHDGEGAAGPPAGEGDGDGDGR